jgi:hypothetical protein
MHRMTWRAIFTRPNQGTHKFRDLEADVEGAGAAAQNHQVCAARLPRRRAWQMLLATSQHAL